MKAIHTPTLEDFEEVVSYFINDRKMLWASGSIDIKKNLWDGYNITTCVVVNEWNNYLYVGYGDLNSYKINILDMMDFRRERNCELLKDFR